jgi:hypothetical protein
MLTRLECLPNEILVEIFVFVSIQDLFVCLHDLNQRFNYLIHSLNHFSLVVNRQYKNDEHNRPAYNRIVRLVIVTLEPFNLQSFNNLRSLIVNLAHRFHIEQIRADNLPHLEYLSIPIRFDSETVRSFAIDIFSNRYVQLRHAEFGTIDRPESFHWSMSCSIRSLHLCTMTLNIIPRLLSFCSQLTHLQIRMMSNENSLDTSTIVNDVRQYPLKHFSFFQMHNSSTIHNIEPLFLLMRHLQHVHIRLHTQSFYHLIHYLIKHLDRLVKFNCHIIQYPTDDDTDSIQQRIRELHPCLRSIEHRSCDEGYTLYTTESNNRITFI